MGNACSSEESGLALPAVQSDGDAVHSGSNRQPESGLESLPCDASSRVGALLQALEGALVDIHVLPTPSSSRAGRREVVARAHSLMSAL
eukprot:SAG31_NODE_34345_length_334_cov_0.651064_1_plen_88_part_01